MEAGGSSAQRTRDGQLGQGAIRAIILPRVKGIVRYAGVPTNRTIMYLPNLSATLELDT